MALTKSKINHFINHVLDNSEASYDMIDCRNLTSVNRMLQIRPSDFFQIQLVQLVIYQDTSLPEPDNRETGPPTPRD